MADDLAALRDALLATAIRQAKAGVTEYEFDGRRVQYASPQEMLKAIQQLSQSSASSMPTVSFAEVCG